MEARTLNRIRRVCQTIKDSFTATSPGPWYMSHSHVISPGVKLPVPAGQRFAPQSAFDVASQPMGKDHRVYGYNPAGYRNNDMRYIATVEPTRMRQMIADVDELLAERVDVKCIRASALRIIALCQEGSSKERRDQTTLEAATILKLTDHVKMSDAAEA